MREGRGMCSKSDVVYLPRGGKTRSNNQTKQRGKARVGMGEEEEAERGPGALPDGQRARRSASPAGNTHPSSCSSCPPSSSAEELNDATFY